MSADITDAVFNTTFTADNKDALQRIKEVVDGFSQLGNISQIIAAQLIKPSDALKEFYGISGQITPAMGQLGQGFQSITDSIKGLLPSQEDLSKYTQLLGKDFANSAEQSSLLTKGLKLLESQGDAAQVSLSTFASTVGSNSEKIIPFTNVLKSVSDNLLSFPESSSLYSTAQKEVESSTLLSQRALQLMEGSIADAGVGFVAIRSDIETLGTTIVSQEQFIKSLSKENKNLAETTKEWMNANKGNTEVLQDGIKNLSNFVVSVADVKARVRETSEELLKVKSSFEVFGKEALTQKGILTQLSAESGLLTKLYYAQDTILKVLNGTQDTGTSKLIEMAAAAYKNRASIQELNNSLPNLSQGIKQVTQDQEYLTDTFKILAENYGPVYAQVFQKIAEAGKLTGNELEVLAGRIEVVAQNSAILIQQSELSALAIIREVEANVSLSSQMEKSNALVQQAVDEHNTFVTALLAEETIIQAVADSHRMSEQGLLEYTSAVISASSGVSELGSSSKELIPTFQNIKNSSEQLKIAYDGTGSSSKDLVKTSSDLSNSFGSLQNIFGRVHRDFGEGEQAYTRFTRASETVVTANTATQKSVFDLTKFFNQLWETVKSFALFQVASTIISAFVSSISNAISTAAEFDQALHNLKAITGATSAEMAGMGDTIKSMASSSIYQIKDIAEGLTIMAQAGLTAGESVSTIKAATNLATGTLEKMSQTVDLLTSTMSSYNISAYESGRVSDILAIAVNNSKLSVDKLRTSLNYVGVIAAQSGLSLEQTSASLMVLADRGMKASTIGTGFRQVLDKLIAPNEKLREAYQSHGIALDKISPLTAGYEEALKNLSAALYDSSTNTVDTSKAFELFGIRGAQAAAILIQAYSSGEWKDAMDSFNESGTAAKMAAEQMQGLQAKWDNLIAKASVLMASLGEGGLTTTLKGLVSVLVFFIDKIQAFLNMDFGELGLITQLFAGFSAVLLVVSASISLYTVVMTSATAATGYLNIALTSLSTSLAKLALALNTNMFFLITTAVTALVLSIQIYDSHLQSLIDKHNKLANEAKQMTGTIDLLQKSFKGISEGSKEYTTLVGRLKNEYPELAKEISKVSGVVDISTLSYKELQEAMEKVRQIKLTEAIQEHIKALEETQNKAKSTGVLFEYFEGVLKRFESEINLVVTALNFLIHGHEILIGWIRNTMKEMLGLDTVNKSSKEAIKNLAQTYVDFGKDTVKSIEDQKAASLAKLEQDYANGEISKKIYDELVVHVSESWDKIAVRMLASQKYYENFSNTVQGIYGDLTAKQRAEIQSVVNEEEKAVEKFTKFGQDKKLSAETIEAEVYAIRLQYQLKALGLLSESTKKEYETQKEKYDRESGLIDNRIALVQQSLEKENAEYEKNKSQRFTTIDALYKATAVHYDNIQTLTETNEDLLRAKRNVTFEYEQKLLSDYLNELKGNQKLQLSVLEGFETEKMKIEQSTAEASLKLIQQRIDAEENGFQLMLQSKTATTKQMEEHTERMKVLIKQEVDARAEAITKTVALGQDLVHQLQEQMNKDLETTKSIYQVKSDIAKQHYDNILFTAQNALTKEYEEITKKNRNEEVVDDLKLQAKIKFWDKSLELTVQASEEESRIRQEEFEKSKAIIDQKLQVQTDYMAKVKGLWDTQAQYTTVTEQQQLESAQRLAAEQETLMKGHTSTFQSESGKRIQTIIDEAAVAGQSIQDQVNEHGIAYVKMTGVTAEELRKQGVDFITTKDGIFQVITQQTLAVQDAAVKETKAYKDGLAEKEAKSIEFVQSEIKRLETLLSAVKKELQDELSEHSKIVDEIKKVRESIVKIHEKVADEIDKINQTTMTDEKKYYDNVRIANEALNKARSTGIKEYVDDAWSKVTGLATGTIKLDNGAQLSAEQTASLKKRMVKEWEEVATAAQQKELKRLEDSKKALEELMAKTQEKIDATMTKLKEFEQLEIKLNTDKFTVAIEDIMKGIDSVIVKLQSIAKEAPVDIDISEFNLTLGKAEGGIAQLKTNVEKIKDAKGNIDITAGASQIPIDEFLTLAKGSLKAFEQYVGKELKPVVETAFKATGYENKSIDETVTAIKESVKTLQEGDGSINSVKPELNINAQMNGVNDTASTIVKGVEDIKTKLGEIPKKTESKHDIAVTGVADLQAAIDKHSQLDGVETHSYHTVHVTTVNDGESDGDAGNQRTGGYISARVGGFIQSLKSGGAFTGKLPGYGGGDIVNARLEPGEFVMRKEAVQNIGVNALRQWNNLNSSAQRSLNPQAGASSTNQMFTGQLHTINLNIGEESNRIYAEPNVLNSLTSSLRRARLMKA